jgi:hypothetical protein
MLHFANATSDYLLSENLRASARNNMKFNNAEEQIRKRLS